MTQEPTRVAPEEPPPLRPELATILATEHWSLLGTRSMTWNEIMSRITIHLAVVSAFLVVLALAAQELGTGPTFIRLAIGLSSAVVLLGTLTWLRVGIASQEDASLVLAMNRLRHAYLDLAPELGRYFSTSAHDDDEGLMNTYAFGLPRNTAVHVIASTAVFLGVANALAAGTLGSLVAVALGASAHVPVIVGVVVGLLYLAGEILLGFWLNRHAHDDVRFPTPPLQR